MTLQSVPQPRRARDPVEKRIAELAPWFHNLHLPSGHQTAPDHPLGDFPGYKWRELAPAIPEDLAGWRALDIGCNAGFYSFELARRGASVVAMDVDERYLRQARWAAGLYRLRDRIEFRRRHVYELGRETERFALVLFLGVLYHLRHPLLALDLAAEKVERMLVVQTLTMPGADVLETPQDIGIHGRELMLEPGWPKAAFIEHRLANDPTNWWAPNHACVEAMLRSCGMEPVARPAHEIWVCEPSPRRDEVQARNRAELDAALARRPRAVSR